MNYITRIESPTPVDAARKRPGRYAVILAGGDGARLKSLTRVISGDDRPKQFCPILAGTSLLDLTRRRVALKFRDENIFYSLTGKHERYYAPLLADAARSRLIVQPENKGTAPAILYTLLHLARRDPDAIVAFFPSDHFISDDHAFMDQTEIAFSFVEVNPGSLVLLGIEPESPETSYGWIEPVESLFGNLSKAVCRVRRFREKPSPAEAQFLVTKGCLWNSFVMIGKVRDFLILVARHLPDLYRMFATSSRTFGTAAEAATMRSLYAWLYDSNFSGEVLQNAAEKLFVLRVSNLVWSDWGEPERVLETLESLGVRPDWMRLVAA